MVIVALPSHATGPNQYPNSSVREGREQVHIRETTIVKIL